MTLFVFLTLGVRMSAVKKIRKDILNLCPNMIQKFALNCSRMTIYGVMAILKLFPKMIPIFSPKLLKDAYLRRFEDFKIISENDFKILSKLIQVVYFRRYGYFKFISKNDPEIGSKCSRVRIYGFTVIFKLFSNLIPNFSLHWSRMCTYGIMAILILIPKMFPKFALNCSWMCFTEKWLI